MRIKFLNQNKAFLLFKVGIFLLLAAPSIASFFIFLSMIFVSIEARDDFLKNRFNYPLFLVSCIIVLSSIINTIFPSQLLQNWDRTLTWIGLFNWIPLFWCFWGFQYFLKSEKSREIIIKIFVSGSIPLIISGFGQIWFNWHGPFGIFNNLIIWFQRPIDPNPLLVEMTGLFNNKNYAGAWLIVAFPMCIACLTQKNLNFYKKFLILTITISVIVAIYLTSSRSAWFGSIISLNLLFSNIFIIFFLISFGIMISVFLLKINIFNETIPLISETLKYNLFSNFSLINILNDERLQIWQESLNLIGQRPFFGWGAGSFPYFCFSSKFNGQCFGHPHNLIFEIAHSYGLVSAILVFSFLFFILFKSFRIIFIENISKKELFEKSWWVASFTLFLSQLIDIQYFDIRISITFWLLISGLTCIIKDNKIKKSFIEAPIS